MGRRLVHWENLRQCHKPGPGNHRVMVHRGKEQAADHPELAWCILPQDWVRWDSSCYLISIANGLQTTPEIWKTYGLRLEAHFNLRRGKTHWPFKASGQTCPSDKEAGSSGCLLVSVWCLCSLERFSVSCSELCSWVLWGNLREALKSRHVEHRLSAHNGEDHAAELWGLGCWVLYVVASGASARCYILWGF